MRGSKQAPSRAPAHEIFWPAVTLSLILMHLTRTVHPQGGEATLMPIAVGAVIMLVVALLINDLSPYRRYLQYWL